MIKFSELNTAKSCEGLVPAIIQDDDTRQVLMLGYLNEEAFDKTVAEGRVTSRAEAALGPGSGAAALISSFSFLPGLKYGTRFGGTWTFTPRRFGLRAMRAPRWRSLKLPNPRSSILLPARSEEMIP